MLSYRTTEPEPQYLQVYVLSNLSAQTWTLAPTAGQPVQDGKLPAAPGLARAPRASTEHTAITLAKGLTSGQQTASFLPLPYPARTVDVDGTWRADPRTLTMFSGQALSGLSYSVASREVTPSVQQLEQRPGRCPTSITNSYLHVPAGVPGADPARRAGHPGQTVELRPGRRAAALVRRLRQVHATA